MSNFTITIVGTGVIGTSLGLGLKQKGDSLYVIGHDKELACGKEAAKMGAFDKIEWNLVNACEEANLIILAIPLNGVKPTLEAIAPYLKEGVVISDTTSNKVSTLAWAKELLPDHAHFIGGNPVVNSAGLGYKNASVELFKGRLYCLTPAATASEDAVQMMVNFVDLLGADTFFIDPAEHDGLIAATEYLPNLLGLTLIETVSQQISWRETRKLAGGLFRQTTAGADGNPDALAEIFLQNSDTLVHWLDQYTAKLSQLRSLLVDDKTTHETLAQAIDKTVVARLNWLEDFEKGDFTDPELVSPKVERPNFMAQMIGFGRLRRNDSNPPKK